jgi:hypothetical protein
MALFPVGGAAIKGRVLASFPSLVEGSGGIRVSKQNGIWTIEPSWSDLAVETTLADASDRELWIFNPETSVYTRLSVQYLLDNLPAGPAGADGSLIFVQNDAPSTNEPEGSIWYDANSTDIDVYQLVSSVWTDTGLNAKGLTGATGASYAATSTSSQSIGNSGTKTFTTQAGLAYQVGTRVRASDASNPTANWMEGVVTSYSSTTLAFTADKSLGSGTLTNWTLSVAGQFGADGAGIGDMLAANNLSDLSAKYTAFDNLSVHGADVASASTTNLETATGNLIDVTGTTTITAITLSEGHERVVRFTGALTLTNGASLVLPGGQNITTATGDYAIFRGYAAGVVRCVAYIRKDGHPLISQQASIASATTTDLGSNIAENVTVSGTTTITSFGSTAPVGATKFVYFSGALLLTHNGTSLILPGAANITTAAGDCLIARHESSGNWRVLTFLRAAGRPLNSGVSDTLTKGFSATSYNAGTQSTGTFTPDPANGNFQYAVNGGAHTLAPPSSDCSIVVQYTNNGSAGAVTTSGFTYTSGDSLTTTNGDDFLLFITRLNGFSHLHKQKLQ